MNGATLLKNGDRPYWKLGAFKQATDFGPNVVILTGHNDTKPQNWGKVGKEYEADLRAMVTHFESAHQAMIYLCLRCPCTRWASMKTVRAASFPSFARWPEENLR